LFEATRLTGYDEYVVGKYRQFRLTAQPAASGTSRLRKSYETPLWLLLGITGLVLLIASVNIANLNATGQPLGSAKSQYASR